MGEVIEGRETKLMKDYILGAFHAKKDEYKRIANECSKSAEEFSIDKTVDRYEDVFTNADRNFTIHIPPLKHAFLKLFRQPYKFLISTRYKP